MRQPKPEKSGEPEPFLSRVANGVDLLVGALTTEAFIVAGVLLLAVVLGASLVGLVVEILLGLLGFAVCAGLIWLFSHDA